MVQSKKDRLEILDDDVLRHMVDGTSNEIGVDFFKSLVKNLAKTLEAKAAWVTEYKQDTRSLSSIAFWLDDNWVDEYEYKISGTPCELVVNEKKLIHVSDKVVDLYPEDKDLIKFKAVSYIGIPLLDTDNNVLGNLAVFDSEYMSKQQKIISIISIFASRAAAELMRLGAENESREHKEKLARLVEGAMDAIIEIDENLKISQINSAALKMFNCATRNIINKNFSTFLSEEGVKKLINAIDELEHKKAGEKYKWIAGGLEAKTLKDNPIQLETTISQLNNDGINFYTLILRNVNERIEAERKIKSLSKQAEYLKEEIKEQHNFDKIIGSSHSLRNVLDDVKKVAPTDSTVLICGETGTGKELIARLIHAQSDRSSKPLIKVNCAAIPSNLIESEFFGHKKGAFTGAVSKREGRFTLANEGTIFLDEIGDLPFDLQAKLLRVLQEGEFEPIGSSTTIRVDVRVIAATNRRLLSEIKQRNFREDLYYRLNVFPIEVPPLRERGDDVCELANYFSQNFANKLGINIKPLSDKDISVLDRYSFPGNIRELQNIIERAVITSKNGMMDLRSILPNNKYDNVLNKYESHIYTSKELLQFERENIIRALQKSNWRIYGENGAAKILGIPSTTLSSRIKALEIEKKK